MREGDDADAIARVPSQQIRLMRRGEMAPAVSCFGRSLTYPKSGIQNRPPPRKLNGEPHIFADLKYDSVRTKSIAEGISACIPVFPEKCEPLNASYVHRHYTENIAVHISALIVSFAREK
jgi:hypothetical protein